MTALAFIKLALSVGTLAMAAFLEYEHQLMGGRDDYIKIALDHLAALLALSSALVDLDAIFSRFRNANLNLKVSAALSVLAAVWCVKSVENNAFPYFKNDITAFRIVSSANRNKRFYP